MTVDDGKWKREKNRLYYSVEDFFGSFRGKISGAGVVEMRYKAR